MRTWPPAVFRVPPDGIAVTPAERTVSVAHGGVTVRLELEATATAVREGLASLRQALAPLGLTASDIDPVELVVAEVLNNVVEHAYAEAGTGLIRVTVRPGLRELTIEVEDDGRPMPGGVLPSGDSPVLPLAVDSLPEGGFGWYLIRTLTRDLVYRRIGPRNCLAFRMEIGSDQPH